MDRLRCRAHVSAPRDWVLSDWHYRMLCIEISERGFRREEPDGAQRETSLILAKVFSALRQEGIGKEEVATALQIDPVEIDRLVFGLILLGLDGGAPAQRKGLRASRQFARYKMMRLGGGISGATDALG